VIRYNDLEERLKRRLVIENDDRQYTVRDCLRIHDKTKAPVVFDTLHHELNSSGETERGALEMLSPTWGLEDGIPMVDYSSARIGGRRASHAEAIDLEHFKNFIDKTRSLDCDIMLEIKDKEMSALKAVGIAGGDSRFFTGKT